MYVLMLHACITHARHTDSYIVHVHACTTHIWLISIHGKAGTGDWDEMRLVLVVEMRLVQVPEMRLVLMAVMPGWEWD